MNSTAVAETDPRSLTGGTDWDGLASADARWHPYAACTHDGPARFYGTHHEAVPCSTCPVAEPCLWAGLALDQLLGNRYGIWGGASARRRDRIAASLPDVDFIAVYRAVAALWSAPATERVA